MPLRWSVTAWFQVCLAQAFSAMAASRTTVVWLWGSPGWEASAVEGAVELGVEAFGVLAHAVEAVVPVAGGGDGAEVFAAVEPCLLVSSYGEEWFPPVVWLPTGAGQGVAGVELVAAGAVFADGGVAVGLVTGQLGEVAGAVDEDDLFEQGAGGCP